MAQLGVDASVAVLAATAELVCDAYDLVKGGISLGKLKKVIEVVEDLSALAASAPAALPELLELDAADSARLGAAGYAAVKKVVEKLKV